MPVSPTRHRGSWLAAFLLGSSLIVGLAPHAMAAPTGDGAVPGEGNESGDAARVTGSQQPATVEIIPVADTQSIGFCNTYTVTVRDAAGAAIIGANVDIHATGPADDLQFAVNSNDPDAAEDGVSDPFTPPDDLVAPPNTHLVEPGAGCDAAGEAPPGDAPDDNDASLTGLQGFHLNPTGADTKHIEGTTDADGFEFSLDSESAGNTAITAWVDVTEDDVPGTPAEPQATAAKTWQTAAASTVVAEPETDTNNAGTAHEVTATVLDQNGNPQSGQTVHFRVTSGPHADDDLDRNAATPPGYFSSCTTDANGRCSDEYTGSQSGTDTITVWVNMGSGETGDAVFVADSDDPQDQVTKTWEAECPGFDGDPRNQIVGTPGNDELEGTSGADVICGLGGDDIISAKRGNDEILGGSGSDELRAGRGADDGFGGAGIDELLGAKGRDELRGKKGPDNLFGGKGPDELRGGAGRDLCRGGPGNDDIKGCEI